MCSCALCSGDVFFFFFKQKTAYEMRISDWSSDVCSSDLPDIARARTLLHLGRRAEHLRRRVVLGDLRHREIGEELVEIDGKETPREFRRPIIRLEIGRIVIKKQIGRHIGREARRRRRHGIGNRSEERSEGKECVRTWKARGG